MKLWHRYGVGMENQTWNGLSKRQAKRLFREVKLPIGGAALLTRQARRGAGLEILDDRYQPDEEREAQR
jgi:hypothetical protein